MKRILCHPINKVSDDSKLSRIIKHLGWQRVDDFPCNAAFWVTDSIQANRVYHNHREMAIDKVRVGYCFDQVFGYPVAINPEHHKGVAVEKRLDHGTHGRVVFCPKKRDPDMCYQKLVGNMDGRTHLEELRIDWFGKDFLVTVKYQRKQQSGMPQQERENGSSVFDVRKDYVLTGQEEGLLAKFCDLIRIDYGSLDAIRHHDGRLYIIDATTNTGMPHMEWHKNLTEQKYLDRNCEMFEMAFSDDMAKHANRNL